ncbi:MAG: hypothetical protein AcusKO_22440 [Acuticoccus sp.]
MRLTPKLLFATTVAFSLVLLAGFATGVFKTWSNFKEIEQEVFEFEAAYPLRAAIDYLAMQRDLTLVATGQPLDDPKAQMFADPSAGLLALRLNNLRSRLQSLTTGEPGRELSAVQGYDQTIALLRETIDLIGRHLAEPGTSIEAKAARISTELQGNGLEARIFSLSGAAGAYEAEAELARRRALGEAVWLSIGIFGALIVMLLAGLALLARHFRDSQLLEAQGEAQAARAEAEAERERTQEILDELPISVRILNTDHGVVYSNRAVRHVDPGPSSFSERATNPVEENAFRPPRELKQSGQGARLPGAQLDRPQGKIARTRLGQTDRYAEGVFSRLSDGSIVEALYEVTDLVNAEQRALQSQREAEDAARAKSTFLANMSHEIRTPMTGVLGMVELLQRTPLSDEQLETLDTINESASALLEIIDDILDFSKIEAGELVIKNVPVDLRTLAESAVELVSNMAERKHLDLGLFVDPELPERVFSDPLRLRQVMLNLLGNAVKFTDVGSVVLTLKRLNSQEPAKVCIAVTDTGIGVPDEKIADLFVPFRQAETSTSRVHAGTGLGLSISQRLVTAIGGDIWAQSQPGKGSTFQFTIPLEAAGGARPDVVDQLDLTGARILIVSPSVVVAEMVSALLHERGASVETASTAEAALATLRSDPPDALVVDGRTQSADFAQWCPPLEEAADAPRASGLRVCGLLDRSEKESSVEYLFRPPARRRLWYAIGVVLGRLSPDDRLAILPPQLDLERIDAPTIEAAGAAGRLILVVEDSAINRKVICKQLDELGYAIEVAEHGARALEMWRQREYGLVLTDCHMPVMDGFELTRTIRNEERSGARRTPIVALTAGALVGDAGRCLDAGMDAYLAKPVRLDALGETLGRWIAPGAEVSQQQPISAGCAGDGERSSDATDTERDRQCRAPAPPSLTDVAVTAGTRDRHAPSEGAGVALPHRSGIDQAAFERLLELFSDDGTPPLTLVEEFLREARSQIDTIERTIGDADPAEAQRAAHTLKSTSMMFGASTLSRLCGELEAALRDPSESADVIGQTDAVKSELATAEREVIALLRART